MTPRFTIAQDRNGLAVLDANRAKPGPQWHLNEARADVIRFWPASKLQPDDCSTCGHRPEPITTISQSDIDKATEMCRVLNQE